MKKTVNKDIEEKYSKLTEEKKQSLLQSFMIDEYKPVVTGAFLFLGMALMIASLITYFKYYKPFAFVLLGLFCLIGIILLVRSLRIAFMSNEKRIKKEIEWKEEDLIGEAQITGKTSAMRNKVAFESIERLNHLTIKERKKYKRKYTQKIIFPRISFILALLITLVALLLYTIITSDFSSLNVSILIILAILIFGFVLSLVRVTRIGEDERILKLLKNEFWSLAALFVKEASPFGNDVSFSDLKMHKLNTAEYIIDNIKTQEFSFYKGSFSKIYSYDDVYSYDVFIDEKQADDSDLYSKGSVTYLKLVIYLGQEGKEDYIVNFVNGVKVFKDSRYYDDCLHYIDSDVSVLESFMVKSIESKKKKDTRKK